MHQHQPCAAFGAQSEPRGPLRTWMRLEAVAVRVDVAIWVTHRSLGGAANPSTGQCCAWRYAVRLCVWLCTFRLPTCALRGALALRDEASEKAWWGCPAGCLRVCLCPDASRLRL